MAPGCCLAISLRTGDHYYLNGPIVGEDAHGMFIELHEAEVLSDPAPDTTSDPFGGELAGFRVRNLVTGRESYRTFGLAGAVRVAPVPPYYVLPTVKS
jgi:hypothetical protein